MDDTTKNEAENFKKFVQAASEACIERGKTYIFTCPVCGGEATASRSTYRGHISAECDKCGENVMQ